MTILVTGAAGFVGLNVVEHLLAAGRPVVGLDRIDLPPRARRTFAGLPGHLTWIGGSILSDADLSRALTMAPVAGHSVDAVIHCAVITSGSAREAKDPEGIVAVNVQGAVATLVAASRRGVRRFVYPSSVAVYGASARGVALVSEDLPAKPLMLYGLTKLACETLLPRIAEMQGLGFAAARLASVYGPWEYATGARDTLSPMLSAVQLALSGQEAVLSQPGLGDFVYSRDVAAGLVALADAPALSHTVYNLGSGQSRTAEDYCRALASVPGFRWRRAVGDEAANTISHVAFDRGALDIARLRTDTAWRPVHDFDTAAPDYLAWMRQAP